MSEAITVRLDSQGQITDVDFVQWVLNEISDKAFTQKHVARTYSILLQKGVSQENVRRINTAIVSRWSMSGLRRIKEQAWKLTRSNQ